jgi:hypothetical protein
MLKLLWKINRSVCEPVDDVLTDLLGKNKFNSLTLGNSDDGLTLLDGRRDLLQTRNFDAFLFALDFANNSWQNDWSVLTLPDRFRKRQCYRNVDRFDARDVKARLLGHLLAHRLEVESVWVVRIVLDDKSSFHVKKCE